MLHSLAALRRLVEESGATLLHANGSRAMFYAGLAGRRTCRPVIWHLRIWQPDGLALTQREHEAVLDAIAARDARGARAAMQAHLELLRKRILDGSDVHEIPKARTPGRPG